MEQKRNKALLIPPFLVFYIINSSQIGVGALSFTKNLAMIGGYQSWIAIILAGITFHLVIWMIYAVLNNQQSDITAIHRDLFGKWISIIPTSIFIVFFTVSAVAVIRTYISVVQIWIFPQIQTWVLALAILLVVYYAVMKGFRVVVGLCFIGVVLPFSLFFSTFFLLEYATFRNLLPIFDTSFHEQLLATKEMTLSYIGPEILLVFYPFIENQKASQKYAHFANLFTMFLYLYIAFFSFIFFAENQITQLYFPTLTAWKVINLPFIERFEYIGVAIWMITILPNMTLMIWGASRLIKQQFNVLHRMTLPLVIIIVFILITLFKTINQIDQLSEFISNCSMYINYAYIPLLLIILFIKKKVKK